jgi:mRNA interferase YafQ
MTRAIDRPGQFRRDYKREMKGSSKAYADKLEADLKEIVGAQANDETPDVRYRDHALSGEWKDHRECHVRPDLLLIYRKPDDDNCNLCVLAPMPNWA